MDGHQFSPPTPGEPALVWEYSGWWRRVAADFIDSLIVFVPLMALAAVSIALNEELFGDGPFGVFGPFDLVSELLFVVFAVTAFTGYYCWIMPATNGQTVGKKALDIRVMREDGSAVSFSFSFARQILVILLLFNWLLAYLVIPVVLNYLWPLWDDQNQALHDKIVKSRVVRASPVRMETPPAWAANPS